MNTHKALRRDGLHLLTAASVALDLGVDDVHAPALPETPVVDPKKGPGTPRPTKKKGGLRMRVQISGGHQVEVRHSSDLGDDVRLTDFDRFSLADVERDVVTRDGKKLVWNQIAKLGHFEGHAAGPFDLTRDRFDEIVRNFELVDQKMVAFDFEHASEADETQGTIPSEGAPACGWIHEIQNRGDQGLFALVEWLEPASGYIKHGRYKQVSPAIRFNAKHPVTGARIGARLTSCALTNKPFLRGMLQVAAKDRARGALGASMVDMGDFLRRCCAALRMGETALPHDMKATVGQLRKHYELADDHHGKSALVLDLGTYTDAIAGLMPHVVQNGGTMGDLLDAVESKIDAAIAEHNLERHDGAAPMTDNQTPKAAVAAKDTPNGGASPASAGEKGETTMDLKELELKLKDAEAKAEAEGAKLKAAEAAKLKAETDKLELELKLKAANAASDETAKRLKALEDVEVTRQDRAYVDEVAGAIQVYGASKGVSLADKDAMLTLLKANPEAFRKIYSPTNPQDRLLMSVLAGGSNRETPRTAIEGAVGAGGENPAPLTGEDEDEVDEKALVDKYVAKGASFEAACMKASDKIAERKAARGYSH